MLEENKKMEEEKKKAAFDALFEIPSEPFPGYDEYFNDFGNEEKPTYCHYNATTMPGCNPFGKDLGYGKTPDDPEKKD